MPAPRRHDTSEAAEALITVAPLISRWIERLLASGDPPLTLAQFLSLRAIANGVTSNGELAHSAGVSAPAASQLVATLLRAELLERREFADDRRRLTLALSPAGKRVLTGIAARLGTQLGAVLTELPHPEADALARALPTVEALLSGAPPPRRPHPPAPGRPFESSATG